MRLVRQHHILSAHQFELCQTSVNVQQIKYAHLKSQYKQLTVGSISSATCPPIFMQLTGQNNGGIACPAFLLARKSN